MPALPTLYSPRGSADVDYLFIIHTLLFSRYGHQLIIIFRLLLGKVILLLHFIKRLATDYIMWKHRSTHL